MKLVIVGAYGNGSVVRSTMEDLRADGQRWEFLGYLDDRYGSDDTSEIIGSANSETVHELKKNSDVFFFFSLNSVKLQHETKNIWKSLDIPFEKCATLVHPTAVVSKFSELSTGVAVQPLVNIGPGVTVGHNVHIFAQAMIGHDSQLGDYSYVANNACIGGHCTLEEGAYVGTNATIIEYITLGRWSLTGMGSVVLKNVETNQRVVGNPARVI